MKIGIVGNRKGWGKLTIYKKLDDLNLSNYDIIVTGGADGVDTYSMDYAKDNGIGLRVFYPDKSKHIPERFFKRNEQIDLYSDKVIAFNKKLISGTQNAINSCYKYNIPVEIITSDCETCKVCKNSAEYKIKIGYCRNYCIKIKR